MTLAGLRMQRLLAQDFAGLIARMDDVVRQGHRYAELQGNDDLMLLQGAGLLQGLALFRSAHQPF